MVYRVAAYSAAGLAFASAAVSIYWTLGGTLLLDTVGGAIEELARERSLPAIFVGAIAALLKVAVGALAVALARNPRHGHRRLLLLSGAVASAALILWGGANVVAGGLVLSDVIVPSTPIDERALRWHVFVWDLWFVVWGVSLAIAVAAHRPRRQTAAARAHKRVVTTRWQERS